MEQGGQPAVAAVEPTVELLGLDACGQVEHHLVVVVQMGCDFAHNLLCQPWFHDDGHEVGPLDGHGIVGGDTGSHLGKTGELPGMRVGHGDV